jgi:uncharacterized membrane protein YqiK
VLVLGAEGTIGTVAEKMSVRGEFRMDSSDLNAFYKPEADGTFKAVKTQPTLGLNWVYKF